MHVFFLPLLLSFVNFHNFGFRQREVSLKSISSLRLKFNSKVASSAAPTRNFFESVLKSFTKGTASFRNYCYCLNQMQSMHRSCINFTLGMARTIFTARFETSVLASLQSIFFFLLVVVVRLLITRAADWMSEAIKASSVGVLCWWQSECNLVCNRNAKYPEVHQEMPDKGRKWKWGELPARNCRCTIRKIDRLTL